MDNPPPSQKKRKLSKTLTTEWRSQCHEVIFEADTPAGKLFDVIFLGRNYQMLLHFHMKVLLRHL